MNARTLLSLIAAFIVLSLIAVLANRPDSGGGSTAAAAAFLPDLGPALESIERVRITGAGDEPIATLVRIDAGWGVEERNLFPADAGRIRAAVNALAEAGIAERKTANPAWLDRLGLTDVTDAQSRAVAISFAPESLGLPRVLLGDEEGTNFRYARIATDPQSYMLTTNPDFSTVLADWLATEILDVAADRVQRIVVEHADGEVLEIFKNDVGDQNYTVANVPEGRSLQYPGVANILGGSLRNLQLEDVRGQSDQDAEVEVRTIFETFDGLVIEATGIDQDSVGWLQFSAATDTTLSNPTAEIIAEAAAINQRTAGWRYRIASYQYSQIARRMADLLSAAENTE